MTPLTKFALRTLAFAAIACGVTQPALAARLTTPINDKGGYGSPSCRLAYFGQKRDLPVKVTIIGYANGTLPEPEWRTFKMGPANRGVQLLKTCDEVGGDLGCNAVRCVFDVPNTVNKADFLGAACRTGAGPKYCVAAE